MDKIEKQTNYQWTSYQCLFEIQNMFRKISFLVIYHLGISDDLKLSVFLVISKITFANLCKQIQDVIVIHSY